MNNILFNIFDLIFNIFVIVGLIYLINFYLTLQLSSTEPFGFDNQFQKQDIATLQTVTSTDIRQMNNDYNDLLKYIYGKSELFSKDKPINDFSNSVNNENNNDNLINKLELEAKINQHSNSALPYNNNDVPLQNDNLLNNQNENIAQVSNFSNKDEVLPTLYASRQPEFPLLNNNSNELGGLDSYDCAYELL